MADIIKYEDVERRIIELRGQKVLLDRDVAELYGVQTKVINQAVRNNPDKFPYGYIFELDKYEKNELVKNFDRFKSLKHSTDRGLSPVRIRQASVTSVLSVFNSNTTKILK